MSEVKTVKYPAEKLREFSQKTFEFFDLPKEDAKLASEVLSMSDIRGIDSHGVARLHTYFDMLENKRINPRPNIKIIRESLSILLYIVCQREFTTNCCCLNLFYILILCCGFF